MAEISRVTLFGKLNSLAYKTFEGATVFCKLRGNPYVELIHWMHQVLQVQDSDLHRLLKHFGVDNSRLAADLTASLERLPRGHTSITDFSPHLQETVERGWVYAGLMFGETQVRTGHLLVGLLQTPSLKSILLGMSREFAKIKLEPLTDEFPRLLAGSPEELLQARDGQAGVGGGAQPGEAAGSMPPAAMGKQEALRRFSVDLTERARKGEIDPVVGRDAEIRQIIDILMRRRQNNPILTGEAGVGKTAIVEGLAIRIAAGDMPPPLKGVILRTLDLGLLQAGASMKGEFENRLRQVIEEVQSSPTPIILFIDEAHTLIGAGGSAGGGDAANLLKPALARGTLRTIAATTWGEYKKYFEKDPALTRRFQVVKVDEPSEEKTLLMMRGLAGVLEKHHRVQILDEALEAAARLAHRYIPARQLPDKSVSLLDTACARVAISQDSVPADIEDCRRTIESLTTEAQILDRESALGVDHDARKADVQAKLESNRKRLAELDVHFQQEKALVAQILDIRSRLREAGQRLDSTGTAAAGAGPTAAGAAKPPVAQAAAPAAAAAPPPASAVSSAETAPAEGGAAAAPAEGPTAAPAAAPPPASTVSSPLGGQRERTELKAQLQALQAELAQVQGERPLILPSVDAQAVASVVADWTGIPVGRMVRNEIDSVLRLAETLAKRVIGQRPALEAIAKRIQTSRAGLVDPRRPIGVFLLAGPSGVGKTETALALAEAIYGGEQNVITINMSEFQEAHTVSTLKGAPPGYVGYGEGGVLTEAVRRRPYSIVLLDEVEKAHRDVHEIFFQVFDKGWMEDGEGRVIDFKNTIILLTTNAGSELIMSLCKDPALLPDSDAVAKALREPLLKAFPAAFLGRLVVVPYFPITDPVLRSIIQLQLTRIERRLGETRKIRFCYDPSVVDLIAARCTEVESGARMVDAILTHSVLPAVSREYLTRLMEGQAIRQISVCAADGELRYDFQSEMMAHAP